MVGKSAWQIEDTFFGAILGAFFGIFIEDLSVTHVILAIVFFGFFPRMLSKAEAFHKSGSFPLLIGCIAWVVVFAYDLLGQTVINAQQSYTLILIFVGWMLSKWIQISGEEIAR